MMEGTADQSGQILPVDATTSIQMVTDNAPAGGGASNTALANLDNMGDSVMDIYFTFEIIEGSAVFTIGGQQTVTVQANPSHAASASFTDQIGENGKIRAYPTIKPDLTAETTYRFMSVAEKYTLSLKVTRDNAVANGTATNTAVATLRKSNNDPASGEQLRFELPQGSPATFSDGTKLQTLGTGGQGQASVDVVLKSEQTATVTLTCTLLSDGDVHQAVTLTFQANPVPVGREILQLSKSLDNQPGDGSASVHLLARLTDENNTPLKGQSLTFSFDPSKTTVRFVGYSGSQAVVSTDPFGQSPIIQVTNNAPNGDVVTVYCSLTSNPAIADHQDLHYTAIVTPPPPPPPPPPQKPSKVSFLLSRLGATQICAFPEFDPGRTARAFVYVKDSNGGLVPNTFVYLSVQVEGYMRPRIVGIQDSAISPATTAVAKTDPSGKIQVNVSLWRGPQQTSGTVKLFANLTPLYTQGDFVYMNFS